MFTCESNNNNTSNNSSQKNKQNSNINTNENGKKTNVVTETSEASKTSICDNTNHTRQQFLSKDNNEISKSSALISQSLSYHSSNDSSQTSNLASTHNTRPSKLHFYGLDTNNDFDSFSPRNSHSSNKNHTNSFNKNLPKNEIETNESVHISSDKNAFGKETNCKGNEKKIVDRSFNDFLTSPAMQQLNDRLSTVYM